MLLFSLTDGDSKGKYDKTKYNIDKSAFFGMIFNSSWVAPMRNDNIVRFPPRVYCIRVLPQAKLGFSSTLFSQTAEKVGKK
ncbi:hypothetical protein BBB57_22705 [Kosakonia sacchari]|nr:hypothetical protein BBB57_22705 [Kosakonia sacchari]